MSSSQSNVFHALAEGDPYVSLVVLGSGAYGIVDKVEKRSNPGTVFVRKTIRITGRNRELYINIVILLA